MPLRIDGRAQHVGQVVEAEFVGDGDGLICRVGRGFQAGGLVRCAPAHDALGEGAVDGDFAVGDAVRLFATQGGGDSLM